MGVCVKTIATYVLALALPVSAIAGGFSIPEQGGRAAGLAGAFTGLSTDPSAIYFNPAGISFLNGMNFMSTVSLISPTAQFQPENSHTIHKMVPHTFVVPNLFFTMNWDYDLSFGVGVYAPFGLGTAWEKGWIGDELSRKIDLKNIHFAGVISYKVMENWAVGASFAYSYSIAELEKKAEATGVGGDVYLKGSGSGVHMVFSTLYKFDNLFNIGITYKSSTDLSLSGEIEFKKKQGNAVNDREGTGTVTVPLPSQLNVGLAVMPMTNLTVSFDYNWAEWSRYSKLEIIKESTGATLISSPRNWNNTTTYRVGVEYANVMEGLDLRGGVLLDQSPVPAGFAEPSLPDNDRFGYTIGFGYKLSESLTLDGYLLMLSWDEKTETNNNFNFNGTYNQKAILTGVSVVYNF